MYFFICVTLLIPGLLVSHLLASTYLTKIPTISNPGGGEGGLSKDAEIIVTSGFSAEGGVRRGGWGVIEGGEGGGVGVAPL